MTLPFHFLLDDYDWRQTVTQKPLSVTVKHRIVFTHMTVWDLWFLFHYVHYFDLLGVGFGFLWSGPVFSPPPTPKAVQYWSLDKECALCPLGRPLELIRGDWRAFGTLSSELCSVAVWRHLHEAIWLQVCVTDQRTHLAFRIKTIFGKEEELWFCGVHIPFPPPHEAVLCYHEGRKAQGQKGDGVLPCLFPSSLWNVHRGDWPLGAHLLNL